MKTMKSAEEFLNQHYYNVILDIKDAPIMVSDITDAMKGFAKMHVQAALKEALDNVPYGSSTDTVSYEDVVGILTCYPLNLIK